MTQELTINEAAERLGCHRTTVWKWICRGQLPSRTQGLARFHYINLADLERFALANNYPIGNVKGTLQNQPAGLFDG